MPADPTTLARIYDDVWGDLDGDPDRTASIVRDMEAVRDAADLDAACAAVAWWGDDVDGRQRERVERARRMLRGEPEPWFRAEYRPALGADLPPAVLLTTRPGRSPAVLDIEEAVALRDSLNAAIEAASGGEERNDAR